MFHNRKEMKPFSPSKSRKVLSKSLLGRSPRRCLSTSIVSASRGARSVKSTVSGRGASSNMKVIVRVRPLNQRELLKSCRQIVKVVDEKMLVFDPKEEDSDFYFHGSKQKGRDMLKKQHKNAEFLFDKVFGSGSTNEEVFQGSTVSLVSSVLDGFNCSVFVYGATGAGKTYTMLGTEDSPGITFLTMAELFQQVEAQKNVKEFDIRVSYLEVYNETVQDLLSPSGPLHLREDNFGVTVAGLKMEQISNPNRMFELLQQGNRNRSQHPTDANAESSRSHAVFQVFIKMTTKSTGQAKLVKLSMIDLAGSERGAATGCAGARFKEGSNINKSLLALGNCINALADGLRHVPYRDSKLTRILKDSLGGNCQTVMIANVAPAHDTFEDTHNTLKYATRAKAIKVKITKNVVSVELHVSNYIKMNDELQKKNKCLMEENAKLREELALSRTQAQLLEETFKTNSASASDNSMLLKAISKPSNTVAVNTSPVQDLDARNEELNRFLEKAEKLFDEKTFLQRRYLNLDSSEKVIHVQMFLKQQAMDKVEALSSTPHRIEATKARIGRSLKQFNGRLISANECQESISHKIAQIDEQLECLKAEAKNVNLIDDLVPRLKALQLKLANRELSVQCEHLEKLVQILSKGIENHDKLFDEISKTFCLYYNLLRGHGFMTEGMIVEHNTLMRHLEGFKSINWLPESILSGCEDPSALHTISKLSSKLSFDSQMSPMMDMSGVQDLNNIHPKLAHLADKVCQNLQQSIASNETAGLSSSSATLRQAASSDPTVAEASDPHPIAQAVEPVQYNVNPHLCSPQQSSSSASPLQLKAFQKDAHQSHNSPEKEKEVSKNMDTATMLDSLGLLNSRVESLLNTSLPYSHTEEKILYPSQNIDAILPSLNSTFDAGEKFSSTLRKDSDLVTSPNKCDNLNVTFDKSPKSGSPCTHDDPLNTTFSIASPCESPQLSHPVAEAKSSPVLSTLSTLPSLKPVRSPAVSSSVGTEGVKTLKSSSPHISSTSGKIVKSSPVFAIPSVPSLAKPRSAVNRLQGEPAVAKRKAILSHCASFVPSSSKLHTLNRKPIGAAMKMRASPSKVKGVWNKENRNTVTSSLPGKFKPGASSKLVTTAGAAKSATKFEAPRKVLNDTFTKASPK